MKLKSIGFILIIALVLGVSGILVACSSGTEKQPVEIKKVSSIEDLKGLESSYDLWELTNDIDASGVTDWTPITKFSGILDGKGFKISGLVINSESDNLGVFAELKGTVKDLTIEAEVTTEFGHDNVGILCGVNSGVIENVTCKGKVDSAMSSFVGGIAGKSTNIKFTNCTNYADITGLDNVGGIVGHVTLDSVGTNENCINYGDVIGRSGIGGVIGYVYDSTGNGASKRVYTLSQCKNEGSVAGTNTKIGGIIGGYATKGGNYIYSINLALSGCVNNGDSVTGASYVGGQAGYVQLLSSMRNCVSKADVTATGDYAGGYIGCFDHGIVENAKNTKAVNGNAFVGGIAGKGMDFDGCENSGAVMANGYVTEGLKTSAYLGGIAGQGATFANCKNTANILYTKAGGRVGGIVGYIYARDSFTVKANENSGNISGATGVGGIIGEAYSYISKYEDHEFTLIDNVNKGNVTASGDYVGGIMGLEDSGGYGSSATAKAAYVKATRNRNEGNITGRELVGGIIGLANYGIKDTLVWETNSNMGVIEGDNFTGAYYGAIYSEP